MCFYSLPFVLQYKSGLDHERMVLVVAPLVSLMVDQVQTLRAKGVSAVIVSFL